MTYQPTTIPVPGELRDSYIPAVILPSGKVRKLMDNEFYSEHVALDLATKKVASGIVRKLKTPKKVDVNLEDNIKTPLYNRPTPQGPTTMFPTRGERMPYIPTNFSAAEIHEPDWFTGGIQYETPDVHKTDHSHGTLDHLAVPGALPDQTPAKVSAVELCRLFGVDRNLMQMQAKVDVNLTAFEEGRLAAQGGKGKRSCPYVKGGIVYYDWMDGFNSYNAGEML